MVLCAPSGTGGARPGHVRWGVLASESLPCLLPVFAAHCCLSLPHSSCCTGSGSGTCKDGKCTSAAPAAPAAPASPAVRLVLCLRKGIWYPGLCLRRGIRQAPAVPDVGKVPPPQARQLYKTDFVFHTRGSALFAMFFYRKCVNDNNIG